MTALPLLYTLDEAAQALRTTPEHIEDLIDAGRLRAVRLFPDEDARVRPEDLLEAVDRIAQEAVR